jgi:hypothetical protein
VQRSSRRVAAVGIVDPPRLVGARRPARREWPGCPAAASLGWSRRKSAACAGWVSRGKGTASKGGQVGEASGTNAGTLAGGNGGTSGGAQEVEALSRMGPEGKPSELSVRTKPSSREAGGEEVASGSGSGCAEDEPGGGVGSRGRNGYRGEPLLGLPLFLGILTARGRWLG